MCTVEGMTFAAPAAAFRAEHRRLFALQAQDTLPDWLRRRISHYTDCLERSLRC